MEKYYKEFFNLLYFYFYCLTREGPFFSVAQLNIGFEFNTTTIHTVGDTEKFRIPFRRTAVARLKNGGKTVRRLLKNGRSIRPRYRFNLSRSPYVSLKEI